MLKDLHGLLRMLQRLRGTAAWDAAMAKLSPPVRSALDELMRPDLPLRDRLIRAFPFEGLRTGGQLPLALAAVAAHTTVELFIAVLSVPDRSGTAHDFANFIKDCYFDDDLPDAPPSLLAACMRGVRQPNATHVLTTLVAWELAARLMKPAPDARLLECARRHVNAFEALAPEAWALDFAHRRWCIANAPRRIPGRPDLSWLDLFRWLRSACAIAPQKMARDQRCESLLAYRTVVR